MSVVKRVLLYVLAAGMVSIGVAHFVSPEPFVRIMPPYLPWHLELVYLSGAFEIALGVAVLVPSLRRLAAWGLIALFVAVYPANIHAALNDISLDGSDPGITNWVRLPFQFVFIAWAWWYTRPDPPAQPG